MEPTWISPGDADDLAERLAARFAELAGRRPTGVYAAPGRVNVIGEHLDYNGGRCLPVALPHATYVAAAPRGDDRVLITSGERSYAGALDRLGPGEVTGWAAYAAGVLWALREQGWPVPGMDLVVDSTLPVGAGLSSSAALECAVAMAVADLCDVAVDDDARRLLVEACLRAEAEVAGAPTGGMDQTVSLLARAGHALLLDFGESTTRQIPWSLPGHRLLVVDSRVAHDLTDGGYASRRAECERAARLLDVDRLARVEHPDTAQDRLDDPVLRRRARHVFTETARVESALARLGDGDATGLGAILTASHVSLRDDLEVSCDELDVAVQTALDQGALGARMTGAGFGGSAVALVASADLGKVAEAVLVAYAAHGWAEPGLLLCEPSPGARQVS